MTTANIDVDSITLRLRSAKDEGAAEMRDWVLRLISDLRSDVIATMEEPLSKEERDRYSNFEEVLTVIAEEIENKTHMNIFDILFRSRVEGEDQGIRKALEYVKQWDANKLGPPGMYEKEELVDAFVTGAADASISIEHGLRDLLETVSRTRGPTHRHYKGDDYMVTGHRIWTGNDQNNGKHVVEYENKLGDKFVILASDFYGEVRPGLLRYQPLSEKDCVAK